VEALRMKLNYQGKHRTTLASINWSRTTQIKGWHQTGDQVAPITVRVGTADNQGKTVLLIPHFQITHVPHCRPKCFTPCVGHHSLWKFGVSITSQFLSWESPNPYIRVRNSVDTTPISPVSNLASLKFKSE
jgi:hypothetical protein